MAKQNEGWMTPVPRQSLSKMVVEKIKEGLFPAKLFRENICPQKMN